MKGKNEIFRYRLLLFILGLFLMAGMLSLLVPADAYAAGGSITISGSGLKNPEGVIITQAQLRGEETVAGAVYLPQTDEWYSTINTWPTKSWHRGQGVKLIDLLQLAGGLNENATLIKFTSRDGFSSTFTIQEFIQEPRYRYPNFMDTGFLGYLPGDPSGAEEVEAIIAYLSCSGQTVDEINNDSGLSDGDANHLLYGQRAVTEQTNSRFVKYVTKIEVLTTDPIPKWNKPSVSVLPGKVPLGTKVELRGIYNDEDKVHYTLDGSVPTIESPMYNWVASRWWKDRKDELATINQPIEVRGNTTIKAIVIGPGLIDSEVTTFEYQVINESELKLSPLITADTANNAVGQKIELTFNENATWSQAIADIKVNGVSISGKYNVTAGVITINAEVFTSAGNYTIVVMAAGYRDAEVQQSISDSIIIPPEGEIVLTIKGDGVMTPKEFTRTQLEEKMNQYQEKYSSINTWPTKSWYVGKGVRLSDLLNEAGLKGNAQQIRFISRDGYYKTLTVQELLVDKRYCFSNFETGGIEGHIIGSSSGARQVEPLLALESASGTNNPDYMSDTESLLLMLGQRTVTEQTGPSFVKYVSELQVLTSSPGKWDKPTADPAPGEAASGTKVKLYSTYNDEDKVYYTTDGSTPTINSTMFNWVASRWWSSRGEDAVNEINKPIVLTKDTTIKAITVGPGKRDSDIAEFTYKVTGPPLQTSDQIIPSQGGQVSLGDEAVLDIPPGALTGAEPVEIKIERVTEPPSAPAGLKILGNVFQFNVAEQTNYSFNKPITIKLKFDPEKIGPGEVPAVFYYDEEQQQWTNLGGQVTNDIIVVQVDHFTMFAVMAADKPISVVTIDPAKGGKVQLGEEAVIEIPAGALSGSSPLVVKLERLRDIGPAADGLKSVAGVYEFSVDGNTKYIFNKPVTLTLRFNSDLAGSDQIPAMYYHDPADKLWIRIGGQVADNNATVQVDHSGQFTVMTAVESAEITLSDIADHWAEDNIRHLVAIGAIDGYPDGTFRPDNNITRAEFTAILTKAFGLQPYSGRVFVDTQGHWAQEVISTAAQCGIVKGYADDTFGPDSYITREQMAVMMVNAAQFAPARSELAFADSSSIAEWAKSALSTAVRQGIIKGYPDNTVRPQGNATRAEAVTVVVNSLKGI